MEDDWKDRLNCLARLVMRGMEGFIWTLPEASFLQNVPLCPAFLENPDCPLQRFVTWHDAVRRATRCRKSWCFIPYIPPCLLPCSFPCLWKTKPIWNSLFKSIQMCVTLNSGLAKLFCLPRLCSFPCPPRYHVPALSHTACNSNMGTRVRPWNAEGRHQCLWSSTAGAGSSILCSSRMTRCVFADQKPIKFNTEDHWNGLKAHL